MERGVRGRFGCFGLVFRYGTVIDHQGGIVALDRATGAVRWRYAAAPPPGNSLGGFAGSLVLDDGGRLIGAGFDGNLIALPARD